MKFGRWIAYILLITTTLCAQAAVPTTLISNGAPSLAPMLHKVMPSVVNIYITLNENAKTTDETAAPDKRLPQQGNPFAALGSGVIVDAKQGYIITNNHLTRNAKSISVNLSDGRKFTADLIGSDALSDIAVLHIKADKLQSIEFANSDKVQVGDFVTAIGNPFGLSQTVTSGIVSALQRTGLEIEGPRSYENFIQIDASINPGNSGGALVNLQGELIGINTAIFSPTANGGNVGIGFAIPSNMVYSVMTQLIKYGRMQRGMVGMLVQDYTSELADAFHQPQQKGAIVTQITARSPAEKAGLQVGDVIYAVNAAPIENSIMVRNSIGLVRAGGIIDLDVQRGGKSVHLKIKSANPKVIESSLRKADRFLFGLGLQTFNQDVPLQGQIKGVQIVSLAPNTPGWTARLVLGDVIVSANQQTVESVETLRHIAAEANGQNLLLNVKRGSGALFVVVKSYTPQDNGKEANDGDADLFG